MAANAVDWRTSGLDDELVRALRPPGETGEWPLTYSDYRLIGDLCDIAGERHPADQALVLALLVARDEGSLCVRVESDALERRLEPVLTDGEAKPWAERIARRLVELPEEARFYGSPDDVTRPLIDVTVGPKRYVYFQRYYLAASQLRERVQERLNDAQPSIQGDWPRILREVVREAPQRLSSGEPLVPSADQVARTWNGKDVHHLRPPPLPRSGGHASRRHRPRGPLGPGRPADDRGPSRGHRLDRRSLRG